MRQISENEMQVFLAMILQQTGGQVKITPAQIENFRFDKTRIEVSLAADGSFVLQVK